MGMEDKFLRRIAALELLVGQFISLRADARLEAERLRKLHPDAPEPVGPGAALLVTESKVECWELAVWMVSDSLRELRGQ